MACTMCGAGLHNECYTQPCCCNNSTGPVAEEKEIKDESIKRRGRASDSKLKDQQSTGRKRAAIDYPLDSELPCEWRRLRFAGGGQTPIIGCWDGNQQARHHGPDKNTLNNEPGNVHRICHSCHNRWHTRNDSSYIPGEPGKTHDSETRATSLEIGQNEAYWVRNRAKKAKD